AQTERGLPVGKSVVHRLDPGPLLAGHVRRVDIEDLGSPKQLQAVLFDDLGMKKTKRTKSGYTTDAAALQQLFADTEHPFLAHLLA
ncbi:hypothetical protein HXP39_19105, partial [Vibrio cholerae O1 biovar El Tor]|nr:hypothetical protein [Vibrio cholerae O1 biovar El Tor]